MTLLALRGVALVRGGRLLFEDFDLSLAAGEAIVLTGPNGVGKSSLIRVAAGLLPPTAGSVVREGKAALADEGLSLDPALPLGRALAFWGRLDGSRNGESLSAMGLQHLVEVPVRMLSTGQRKRAVLARVLGAQARLWLLDEPLNGLDDDGRDCLLAAIAAHRTAGGAILAASHQPLDLPDAQTVMIG